MRPIWRSMFLAGIALITASCGSSVQTIETPRPTVTERVASEVDESSDADVGVAASTGAEPGGIDLSATRTDIDCTPDGLGEDDLVFFVAAHYVVDGVLGALCLGEADDSLIEAWTTLSDITPGLQLADLSLFAGFVSNETGNEFTLAFVNPIDDDGTRFQMSINLDEYDQNPDEAGVTLAHEFSHVFTSLESQLDREIDPEFCTTYHNSEGCYTENSIMWQWITLFWSDGLIDEVDPEIEATAAEGEDRCDQEEQFFGPYAASNPEEDFAETFGAFVFRVEPQNSAQQEKYDWLAAQPGLLEFRQRAIDAGDGPVANDFELCGIGS